MNDPNENIHTQSYESFTEDSTVQTIIDNIIPHCTNWINLESDVERFIGMYL